MDPLSLSPADLDADIWLRTRLESIRHMVGATFASLTPFFSESQPKICIVGPPASYTSTSGALIPADTVDCRIRAVSVGNFHRTVPATMLSALAVARAVGGTIVEEQCRTISNLGGSTGGTSLLLGKKASTIKVGQPAGVSKATATLDELGRPESILYVRTARRLMAGHVLVPQSIFVHDNV
jgi:2-methylaconitate cis-trans-isomerase PrpF